MREPVEGDHRPEDVLRALRADPAPFALVGRWAGSRAILGSAPVESHTDPVDPFALLELPAIQGPADFVGGGWFGHLGFQLGALVEDLTPPPPRPDPIPRAALAFYDHRPEDVLRALRADPAPFALVGRWAGSRAILGSAPVESHTDPVDPFALLELPAIEGPAAFVGGGWFGHLGFQLGALVEDLTPPPPRPDPIPRAALAFYDHVLRQDADGRWWFEALETTERRERLRARLETLRERLRGPVARRPWRLDGMRPRPPGYAGHRAAVADCVERIAAGEIFQANLCLRLDGSLSGEPLDAFADAVPALTPDYGAFFGHPWGAIVSFSPELFLRRVGAHVHTALIKGTAPRPDDPATAAAQRELLAGSAKDAAENVMIVDLMRNDLGRVARYGSVRAGAPQVQPHPGVWHLVSRVEADLRDGVGDRDLLRAAFPPGSVTGAPKVQALQVIHALEATARETYTGAIGYGSPAAGLELNVAIRTFEISRDRVWLGCGGGVVADSDPDAELAEALAKAEPLVRALGGTVPAPDARARRLRRDLPLGAPRPEPREGLLETLRVAGGHARDVGAHLARLAASARAVLGADVPADLAERIAQAARELGDGRLRVRLEPTGVAEVTTAPPALAPPSPLDLVPIRVPGGLGSHKWADRRLVESYETATATPLIVDADGAVLEAGWANVWILDRGRLLTPAADGRLLPGTVRAELLRTVPAAAEVDRLDLDRVDGAEAVVLTSSVRLITPARTRVDPDGRRAATLAAELRRALAAEA